MLEVAALIQYRADAASVPDLASEFGPRVCVELRQGQGCGHLVQFAHGKTLPDRPDRSGRVSKLESRLESDSAANR